MTKAGQIVLFKFPQTNLLTGKYRPALLLGKVPGKHDDFLICMISSKLHNCVEDFDEIITQQSSDFKKSGLKVDSLIRLGRLAIIENNALEGAIGEISPSRMKTIISKLTDWLNGIIAN